MLVGEVVVRVGECGVRVAVDVTGPGDWGVVMVVRSSEGVGVRVRVGVSRGR